MYIYQTLPSGVPAGADWDNLTEGMRVIELDGHPQPMVGIKFRANGKPPPDPHPALSAARVASGSQAGPGPESERSDKLTYWADRSGGCCGGQRLRSTLTEDLAVSDP